MKKNQPSRNFSIILYGTKYGFCFKTNRVQILKLTGDVMTGKIVFPLSVIFCMGLCFVFCNPSNSSKASTVARLKINNGDITGWTIQKSGDYYTPDDWAAGMGIDGEAYRYSVDPGLTWSEVLDERMQNASTGTSVRLIAIDYTNAANAGAMFIYKKTHAEYASNPEPLTPDYADTVAVGENANSAICVCAHFKQFYLELRYDGYIDFSLSKQDALSFLGLLEAKINGN
jgi:hypothetical protein